MSLGAPSLRNDEQTICLFYFSLDLAADLEVGFRCARGGDERHRRDFGHTSGVYYTWPEKRGFWCFSLILCSVNRSHGQREAAVLSPRLINGGVFLKVKWEDFSRAREAGGGRHVGEKQE